MHILKQKSCIICLSSMKSIFTLLLFVSFAQAMAQVSLYDSVNRKREKINKTSTLILGGWAFINVGTGIIAQSNTTGELKQFYRANAISGGVNLALAGIGLLRNRHEKTNTVSETFKKQEKLEKFFLFNVALDLGYVAYGLYTKERSYRYSGKKRERLAGTGNSILFQSGVLTLFDGIVYLLHTKNGNRLEQKLQNLSFTAGENGLGLAYRF